MRTIGPWLFHRETLKCTPRFEALLRFRLPVLWNTIDPFDPWTPSGILSPGAPVLRCIRAASILAVWEHP
jgi:hypothetical protein